MAGLPAAPGLTNIPYRSRERLIPIACEDLPAMPGLPSVLFVDDEPQILSLIRRALTGDSATLRTAQNGEEAIEAIAAMPVDLLVSDYPMGRGMDGAALLARAHGLFPRARLVLHTATPPPNCAPIFGIWLKPVPPMQFRKLVEEVAAAPSRSTH